MDKSTDDELAALQQRATKLHAAQLLADEELYAVEDLCADYVELQASVPEGVLTKDAIYSVVGHCFIAVRRLRPRLCFKGKGTRLAGVGRRQRRARQKTAAPTAQFASGLDFGLTSLDFC